MKSLEKIIRTFSWSIKLFNVLENSDQTQYPSLKKSSPLDELKLNHFLSK